MIRLAYTVLVYLLTPVYAAYWLIRSLGNRNYRDRLPQRFGFRVPRMVEGCIWLHAVSVGEVQASAPLVRALRKKFSNRELLITTVTPTGAARAVALFGDSIQHCYIPFETPGAVVRFFDSVRPDLALIMETELWPNLYRECGRRNIPLVLVSARISPKSVDRYRRFLPLFRETLSHGIVIAAQSERDAERFRSLGAAVERTWVTGNIKFDVELPVDLIDRGASFRRDHFAGRPVWIAASTHDQEEEQVLAAHRLVREKIPDALLILVPRHPERFLGVSALLQKQGVSFVSRTDEISCPPDTEVFLGDTMGEVLLFYAAGDIAFVGGSLVPIGGHNLLEPAALGRPVITGPHLFNFQDIAGKFAMLGAVTTVANATELGAAVTNFFSNQEDALEIGSKGREIVEQNRGALERLLKLLAPLLHDVA